MGACAVLLVSYANSFVLRARSKLFPANSLSIDRFAKVEKYPDEFDIDMIRCIFCGMCEEVCPEQAIFLRKDYAITGFTRADMVHRQGETSRDRWRNSRRRPEMERKEINAQFQMTGLAGFD